MDMYEQGNYNKPLGTLKVKPHTYRNQTKRGQRNVGHGGLQASWQTSFWFLWRWSRLTAASLPKLNFSPVWTDKDQFLPKSTVCEAVQQGGGWERPSSLNRKNRDQVDKGPVCIDLLKNWTQWLFHLCTTLPFQNIGHIWVWDPKINLR